MGPEKLVKVMEYVEGGNIASLLRNYYTIPSYVKLSILQDICRGIHYLHTQDPPIVHGHINTSVIMLTATLTAKIGSFTFAQQLTKNVSDLHSSSQLESCESLCSHASFSFDVYSLGFVVCQVTSQANLGKLYKYVTIPETKKLIAVCDFKYCQAYLDIMREGPLKELAILCLDVDPAKRPSMPFICKRMDEILNGKLFISMQSIMLCIFFSN